MRLFTNRSGSYTVNRPDRSDQIKENKSASGTHPLRVSSDFSPARKWGDIKQAAATGRSNFSAFLRGVSASDGKKAYTGIYQMLSPGRHRWGPEERFLIGSSKPDIYLPTANNSFNHGVPATNLYQFSDQPAVTFGRSLYSCPDALSVLDETSRLDLIGHGNANNFDQKNPRDLASVLHRAGLRKVGVIKIAACSIGKKNYLRDFMYELDRLDIKVGYVSGAKDDLQDRRVSRTVNGKVSVINSYFSKTKMIGNSHETFGLAVVKGNIDVQFANTRYTDASAMPRSSWQ